MKADSFNNERSTASPESSEAPQRTHRLLFGRQVHRGTVLIALLFVLGVGWILWESRSIGPEIAVAEVGADDSIITMTLDQMRMEGDIGPMQATRREQLFGPFLKDAQRRTLRLHSLPRDPFTVRKKEEQPVPETQPVAAPVVVEETPPSVEGLELRSILIGEIPTAIINGYLVQEGQVIAEWTIVQILPEKVVLQWKHHQHVLTMP